MKAILLLYIVIMSCVIFWLGYLIGNDSKKCPDSPTRSVSEKVILKQTTDDRGLTSVIFRENGEEWGYDYLTRRKYDSIFHSKN